MRTLPALFLVACGSPISNQTFHDDARMVAALPSAERLAAPEGVRTATVGDHPVLAEAVTEAATVRDLVEVLLRSGEALRAAEPSERTDVARAWQAVQVAGDLDGRRAWWVQAEVLQPDDEADLSWDLAIAPGPDGPFVDVGVGAHAPDGDGAVVWQLGPTLEALGLDPAQAPGELQIGYTTEDGQRAVELLYVEGDVQLGPWAWLGDSVLVWQGPMPLGPPTPEGTPTEVFGSVAVVATADGGWAQGSTWPAGAPQPFDTCWNAAGDRVYEGGDRDPTGDVDACPFPQPF